MYAQLLTAIIAIALCSGAFAADQQDESERGRLMEIRKGLNVNMFSSAEYPAIFGIIAGISIVLIVAVAFIVVGLLSMEPAKDSIIYRMTNTRMKKD